MCRAHATVRGLVGELVSRAANGRDIILDMEAGLEHLSRGTGRHVTRFVAVLEPYFRSMETARRVAELATELGSPDVVVVSNKVRDAEDRKAIADFCSAHSLRLIGEVPYGSVLLEAERAGVAPIDFAGGSAVMNAISALAHQLRTEVVD